MSGRAFDLGKKQENTEVFRKTLGELWRNMKRDKAKYKKEYPRLLYTYFVTYQDTIGVPSFSKFARSIGVTVGALEGFRRHKEFDEAYRECNEIRRDYLIDNALCKRFDSSFTKFLLASEYSLGERAAEDKDVNITLEIVGGKNEA